MKLEDQIIQEMFEMLENVLAKGGVLNDMTDFNNLWRLLSDLGSELIVNSRPSPAFTIVKKQYI